MRRKGYEDELRVLVTNDDGIESPGIRALVKALAGMGYEVYVAAPLNHASATGKGMRPSSSYGEASLEGAVAAWWVDSTPASAVYLALHALMKDKRPDIVVSGINKGPNAGLEDFLTSGTVGAAIEAALHGVPGLAVSLASDGARSERDYALAARLAAGIAWMVASIGPGRIVNLNVPSRPRGVAATRLAWNNYRLRVMVDGGRAWFEDTSYKTRYWDAREGTDVWAILNDLVSVTLVDLRGFVEASEPPRELAEALEAELREAVA